MSFLSGLSGKNSGQGHNSQPSGAGIIGKILGAGKNTSSGQHAQAEYGHSGGYNQGYMNTGHQQPYGPDHGSAPNLYSQHPEYNSQHGNSGYGGPPQHGSGHGGPPEHGFSGHGGPPEHGFSGHGGPPQHGQYVPQYGYPQADGHAQHAPYDPHGQNLGHAQYYGPGPEHGSHGNAKHGH